MNTLDLFSSTLHYSLLSNTVRFLNHVIKVPLMFVLVISISACSNGDKHQLTADVPSLPVWEVEAGKQTTYQEYPAAIEGLTNVEIRPQVTGTLDKVLIDEGSFVKKGQPLFKINDQPYREQVNAAQASLAAARGAVENAKLEMEKLAPLVEKKVVSDFQLRSARAAYRVATGNLEQAKASLASARINLGYTLVKAPVNGYIGRLFKKQGSLLSPTDPDPLTTLSDVHDVRVYFSLAESDFVQFKTQYAGASLNEKLKNVPPVDLVLSDQTVYEAKGRLDMVDGRFDKNTGAITIRATFPNKQGLLREGNTGRIRLGVTHSDVVVVPQSATLEIQDKIFVFAVGDSNKVSKKPITVVGKNSGNYLVKEGIKAGDRIVYKGMDHLQEDQIIRPEALPASEKKLAKLND